jgi:hypothetical protein
MTMEETRKFLVIPKMDQGTRNEEIETEVEMPPQQVRGTDRCVNACIDI